MLILLFSLLGLSSANTDLKKLGNLTTSERVTLAFHISSKPGMECFYQNLDLGSKLRVTFFAVNKQLQPLHMRISSPNDVFSEWFEGVDRVEYSGETAESGVHEVCVTAKIGFGSLKVILEIFSYNPKAIEESFNEYIQKNKLHASLQRTVEKVFEKAFSIFYSLRNYNYNAQRDTHLQEKNISYIDGFSTVQTVFMVVSALVQVFSRFYSRADSKSCSS